MEIAYAILLGSMYFIGYFTRSVVDSIREMVSNLSGKLGTSHKPLEDEEPKSTIVEALTPEQEARLSMENRMKRINQ